MPSVPLTTVLLDIEGTTTPIAFVHRVLFPYARAALPALLRKRAGEPEVAAAIAETIRLAPGRAPLEQLLDWMDQDAKVTPLKTLQGIAWRDGYAAGALVAEIYPDVAPALRGWRAGGVRLAVYSSGSEEAQRLIFGHGPDGDLCPLFEGFFDTRVGMKRDASSYVELGRRLGTPPGSVLFLSDIEAELDAASSAGLATCQLVRDADGTVPGTRHPVAADFGAVTARFALPGTGATPAA